MYLSILDLTWSWYWSYLSICILLSLYITRLGGGEQNLSRLSFFWVSFLTDSCCFLFFHVVTFSCSFLLFNDVSRCFMLLHFHVETFNVVPRCYILMLVHIVSRFFHVVVFSRCYCYYLLLLTGCYLFLPVVTYCYLLLPIVTCCYLLFTVV